MDASLNWIKAYVPELETTSQDFCDAMTLSGTKVESFTVRDKNLDKIVIGQIESIAPHPDADKLVICQVNIGTEVVQIVTGAPNVAVGQKVPVVLDGGKVAGGHDGGALPADGIKIKKGKLRGVESCGMMCSIEELGSSREFYPEAPENGIYVFPEDVQVGADAVEALGLHDTEFEFEITSNRVDCYSILGIAREAACTYRKPFVPPVVTATGNSEKAEDYIKVRVEDGALCKRYCARVVKNIKLAPSPEWMQRRLASSGIRPINNLVDITNYVMEEYGQPMHAYDYDLIAGKEIVVKRAQAGETFMTLDGVERTLDENVLMINDGEKAVGIAGIMGGENSKITDNVKTMVFEGACFDGTNIRLSAKRLGLRTDASGKFEKGLDPNNAEAAINRACQLIEELGCGEVVGGMVDIYPEKNTEKRVKFDSAAVNKLLGTDISREQMLEYFKPLELVLDETTDELIIPTFRQDLLRPCDIAEEVARFYGYDKIPVTLPKSTTSGKKQFKMEVEDVARNVALFAGFSQAMNYSFESRKVFDKLLIPEDHPLRNVVVISNPLGEDFSVMRTTIVNGMLNSLATNYNRRNKDVRLFELANIYLPVDETIEKLPDERLQFMLGFYGAGDFFTMKGVVEEFFAQLGMKSKARYDAHAGIPYLHPGRQANIIYANQVVGYLGEVHPQVQDNYGIGERAYIANIDIPAILSFVKFAPKFEGIAKFPAVTRDLSMVMKKELTIGEVEELIAKKAGKLLEDIKLFDIYEGAQIAEGHKSVAFSLVFRSKEKTLEDSDINPVMDKILKALTEKGISLRQ
jgi:phenylalanyl-tRNA synthetase beta chain